MNIIPFDFGSHAVRVITDDDGNPMFVAKDIADVLGYKNPSEAVADHCKYVKILKTSNTLPWVPPRGYQIIPESDVYRLIMRSHLESAERFQDWVTEEVLPSIRKTGSYNTPHSVTPITTGGLIGKESLEMSEMLGLPIHVAQIEAVKTVKRLTGNDHTDLLRHAPAQDNIPESDLYLEPTELGKHFELSAQQTNKMLSKLGLQEKIGDRWEPTETGKPLSYKHSWSTAHGKSGYNLKWKLDCVKSLLT